MAKAKNLDDFGCGKTFQVAELKCQTEPWWQITNLFFHQGHGFRTCADLLRVEAYVNNFVMGSFWLIVQHVVQGSFRPAFLFSANHQSRVNDDPRQPSGE